MRLLEVGAAEEERQKRNPCAKNSLRSGGNPAGVSWEIEQQLRKGKECG
jgi:hypothetical protein